MKGVKKKIVAGSERSYRGRDVSSNGRKAKAETVKSDTLAAAERLLKFGLIHLAPLVY